MENLETSEWVAIYGAGLSTAIFVSNFFKWLFKGPQLSVSVFNPDETDMGGDQTFLAIISNSGNVATVVQKLEISFRTSRWFWAKEIGSAKFGERSNWKPGVKLVPIPDRPNNFRPEPNIILPGEELRAPAKAVTDYASANHWIRVTAYARNRRKGFTGWSPPSINLSKAKVRS